MPRIAIPVTGPTYRSSNPLAGNQYTANSYLEISQNADKQVILQSFPGLKAFSTTTAAVSRGFATYDNDLYSVVGQTLYKTTSDGTSTNIGSIPGAAQCGMIDDGINLVITTGHDKPWTWDGTTLTQGTDIDLPNANTVTYMNRRVIYDGSGQDVVFPELDDPLNVNSLNVTSADTDSDDTIAVHAHNQQLFAFGSRTITPYYNSGAGYPPFDVIQNSIKDVGLSAIHSVCSNDEFMYFLGSDLQVYRFSGLTLQVISDSSLATSIGNYDYPDRAKGFCFTLQGQRFYILQFPGVETWLYSEGIGWTNLTTNGTHDAHPINGHAKIWGRDLIIERTTGNILELDFDTFTNNGDTILRQRDTLALTGEPLGVPGQELFMSTLGVVIKTGVGVITGQGTNPQIMMQYSDDGGRTWSSDRVQSMGKLGEYLPRKPIEWHDVGSFYSRRFRLKVSDPVDVSIIGAYADVEVGSG